MSIVEVMVGVVVLAICTPPILACVVWMRSSAADATIDAQVASELTEQIAIVRSLGQSAALATGSTASSQTLGNGVTLNVNRTVSAVAGRPRLYKLIVVGNWTSRTRGGIARTLTVETNVFAPNN